MTVKPCNQLVVGGHRCG